MKRLIAGVTLLAASSFVQAYDLPPVNLGGTSFLDVAPNPPGLYILQYLQQYHSNKFKDGNGKTIPLSNPDLDVTLGITQLIYGSDQEFLGGKLGIQTFLPELSPHTSYSVPNGGPQAGDSGFGDLVVGPFITWGPLMGGKLFHRIELTTIIPTGNYDRNREINPGSNIWSFNPFWSATYFFTPELSASIRAHYLWNGKNNDPNRGFGAAHDVRPGQAYHLNLAAEYAFTPQFRLGLNAYWLKSTTDTEVDGHDVDGHREQVLGLGVGGVYSFSQKNHLFFNYYNESKAENRTEGQRYNMRFVHSF
jgi:hypothetical protein